MPCCVLDLVYLTVRSHEQILVKSKLGALHCCENISKYLRSSQKLFLIVEERLELRVGGYTDADDRMSISVCILELY